MAKILFTNGKIKDLDYMALTLDLMHNIVGGYIEMIPLPEDEFIICNEDGTRLGLPINKKASDLYKKDIIVGDVIIAKKNEIC